MKANCLAWSILVALTFFGSCFSVAQEIPGGFPNQPIHIVVGNAAGGGNDILARLIGQKLSDRVGRR